MNASTFIPISKELWYGEPRSQILASIGGKALGLSSIAAADLPSPTAIVISTAAYRGIIRETQALNTLNSLTDATPIQLGHIRRELESIELSDDFTIALHEATNQLTAPFAVRSSTVVEDALTSSWAGQFLTILSVQPSGLTRSVARCWSSVFTPPVASYASTNGLDLRQIYMAVIIQQMVRPIWAGVLFTGIDLGRQKNPNSVLLEAVRGLGEKLVNGTTRPEYRAEARLSDFSIRSSEARQSPDTRHTRLLGQSSILPDLVISELAKGASRLQEVRGKELMDIEWAWDGHVAWFLQARPLASQ